MKTNFWMMVAAALTTTAIFSAEPVWAAGNKANRRAKIARAADKNNDGFVSAKERKAARDNYLANNSEADKNWEKKADTNNDGKVDAKELSSFRRNRVDTAWEKKADTNHDGVVSKDEAKTAAADYLNNRSTVDKNWEKKADTNNDGKVDAEELAKWSRAHDGFVSPAEAKKIRDNYLKNKSEVDTAWEKKADPNGDGKVDAKELNYWRRHRVDTAWEKKADTNGDGIVSREELQAARAKRRANTDTTTSSSSGSGSATTTE